MDEESDETRTRRSPPTMQSSSSALSHSQSHSSGWCAVYSKPRGSSSPDRCATGLNLKAPGSGSPPQVKSAYPTPSTALELSPPQSRSPLPSIPARPQPFLRDLLRCNSTRGRSPGREPRVRSPGRKSGPRSRESLASTACHTLGRARSQPIIVAMVPDKSINIRGGDRSGDSDYDDSDFKTSLKRKGPKIGRQTRQRKKARSNHHKSSNRPALDVSGGPPRRLSRSLTKAEGLEVAKSRGLGQHLGWTRGSVMTYQSLTDDSMH